MNAKKLFLGLLIATVVMTPFATVQPASAVPMLDSPENLIQPNVSKYRLGHRFKAALDKFNKKLKTESYHKQQKQYKHNGKKFENAQNNMPNNPKFKNANKR